ncbi:MAG: hypothetical protein P1V21_17165 [Rhizobiaceae bacterium]|nr:hypothetical protein [Rhizobiaceae bacterium]
MAIVLFLLPFAKSLSVSGLFSYQAKIEEIKKDVSEFKSETRDLINIQNALISNVTNSQTTHNVFNIPSWTDARSAEKELGETGRPSVTPERSEKIELAISNGPAAINVELARTRMEIEAILRKKMGRRTSLGGKRDIKYISLMGLWREFLKQNTDKANYDAAMRYVVDICNAAIHGQNVPQGHAIEALQMGEELISALDAV